MKTVALTVLDCGSGHELQYHGGRVFRRTCGAYFANPQRIRRLVEQCPRRPVNPSADQRRRLMLDGKYPIPRDGRPELQGRATRLGDVGEEKRGDERRRP